MKTRAPLGLSWLPGLALAGLASAATYRVDDSGGADFTSIQAAIQASTHGDLVLVEPGTYYERLTFGGRRITVRSTDGAERTIIDAEDSGPVVIMSFLEAPSTVLEGFTLQNGRGQAVESPAGGGASGTTGAGKQKPGSTDRRAAIIPASAHRPSEPRRVPAGHRGGGITYGGGLLLVNAAPTLRNLIVRDCFANTGGGIWGFASSPSLEACQFLDNFAGDGGAAAFEVGSDPVFHRCRFEGHDSASGGAAWASLSEMQFFDCAFEHNSAGEGGAIYLLGSTTPSLFERCLFLSNLGGLGSSLFAREANASVTHSTFAGNGFPDEDPGEIYARDGSEVTVTRSILYESASLHVIACDGASIATSCCDIWPTPPLPPPSCPLDPSDFSLDPLFCAPADGDYRLRTGSPCLPSSAPGDCGLVGALSGSCDRPDGEIQDSEAEGRGQEPATEGGAH